MAGVNWESLKRLLDENLSGLVLYARQWCDTPEDVVQDAFVAIMQESQSPDNPAAWLYRAVRNKALNAGRSSRRRARHEAVAAHRGDACFAASNDDHLDAETAAAALAGLPVEEREVIVARLWGALTFEQIAELAGTSVSTAYRHYQQGIAALREKLEEGKCPQTVRTKT